MRRDVGFSFSRQKVCFIICGGRDLRPLDQNGRQGFSISVSCWAELDNFEPNNVYR